MATLSSRGVRSTLDVIATIAIVTACAVFVWAVVRHRPNSAASAPQSAAARPQVAKGKPKPLPSEPVDISTARVIGRPSAKLAVILYSDFQCPFCANFANGTLPEILKQFVDTGKVQFAFRHLPLQAIHPFALKAAEAAECGGAQGKFWEVHDALFALSGRLDPKGLRGIVDSARLDEKQFGACIKGETTEKVKLDLAEARTFGITGTPTFLFGRVQPDGRVKVVRRESGALPVATFSQVLEELSNQ
jgi:protein-disulfide isomerase